MGLVNIVYTNGTKHYKVYWVSQSNDGDIYHGLALKGQPTPAIRIRRISCHATLGLSQSTRSGSTLETFNKSGSFTAVWHIPTLLTLEC